jgi:hypothetical protein
VVGVGGIIKILVSGGGDGPKPSAILSMSFSTPTPTRTSPSQTEILPTQSATPSVWIIIPVDTASSTAQSIFTKDLEADLGPENVEALLMINKQISVWVVEMTLAQSLKYSSRTDVVQSIVPDGVIGEIKETEDFPFVESQSSAELIDNVTLGNEKRAPDYIVTENAVVELAVISQHKGSDPIQLGVKRGDYDHRNIYGEGAMVYVLDTLVNLEHDVSFLHTTVEA